MARFMCRKQLKDFFNTTVLHQTITQILDTFMSTKSPHHWLDYLMPEDARLPKPATASDIDEILSDVTEFDKLMAETRAVLTRYVDAVAYKILVQLSSSLLKG